MNLKFLLDTVKYWYEFYSAHFLPLYVKYFIYLMYIKDLPFTTFSINLAKMCTVQEKSANFSLKILRNVYILRIKPITNRHKRTHFPVAYVYQIFVYASNVNISQNLDKKIRGFFLYCQTVLEVCSYCSPDYISRIIVRQFGKHAHAALMTIKAE